MRELEFVFFEARPRSRTSQKIARNGNAEHIPTKEMALRRWRIQIPSSPTVPVVPGSRPGTTFEAKAALCSVPLLLSQLKTRLLA